MLLISDLEFHAFLQARVRETEDRTPPLQAPNNRMKDKREANTVQERRFIAVDGLNSNCIELSDSCIRPS